MPRAPRQPATLDRYSHTSVRKPNNPTVETWAQTQRTGVAAPVPVDGTEAESPPRLAAPRLDWNDRDAPRPQPQHAPLYTHDKVSPRNIIAGLLQSQQTSLFDHDFNDYRGPNGERPSRTDVAWQPYQYTGHWHNRLIRATAQRAMLSLIHRECMRGDVQLIYIDPPYNKSFKSNFAPSADSLETSDQADGIPYDPVAIQAFRDNYAQGIDSYLDGLREQLELARELLADSGSCIIQIGPDNLHYVAVLMAEVFGRQNHVATIPYVTSTNQSTKMLAEISNWLVWYSKNKADAKYRQLYEEMTLEEKVKMMTGWAMIMTPTAGPRHPKSCEKKNPNHIPNGDIWYRRGALTSSHTSDTGRSEPWSYDPEDYPNRAAHYPELASAYPWDTGKHWRVSHAGLHAIAAAGRMHFDEDSIGFIEYADEMPGRRLSAMWHNIARVHDKQYIVETPSQVLDRCLLMTTDPGDLVLDLTCGSGAMPLACERWGRRWIAVDVSAVSIAIARDRLLTATHDYHLLKDSPEGAEADHDRDQALLPPTERNRFAGSQDPADYEFDPAQGFVNERQMRISAATLAYGANPDGRDVIYHPDRTAKDEKKVRVSADFEVCSDSPYRTLSPNEELAHAAGTAGPAGADLASLIRDTGFTADPITARVAEHLEICGIGASGRILYRVENLQPAIYRNLTHSGTIVASDGTRQSAAFYIAKADEIISTNRVDQAAQDAAKTDCSHLVFVGFGQDSDAFAAGKPWLAQFQVLHVNANRDLQLEHLKNEQRPNGFTIISEPEVCLIRTGRPDEVQLEVIGITAYDAAKGNVDFSRDVMAFMIDNAYDGTKFLPTCYNIRPCKRNANALKGLYAAFKRNMDEATWKQIQTLTSLPFALPEETSLDGDALQVAVKVIDQTGTEHRLVIDDPRAEYWYAPRSSRERIHV